MKDFYTKVKKSFVTILTILNTLNIIKFVAYIKPVVTRLNSMITYLCGKVRKSEQNNDEEERTRRV